MPAVGIFSHWKEIGRILMRRTELFFPARRHWYRVHVDEFVSLSLPDVLDGCIVLLIQ
jgi:hypothetical protein